MSLVRIATFESRSKGTVEVVRGLDEATREKMYRGAFDPGIVATLGQKDQKRFSPTRFPEWVQEGGGKFGYTAYVNGNLAGLFWVGGKSFPIEHFPDAPAQPEYTAAWRTAYSDPEGGTFDKQGIGKRLAVAGLADVIALTKSGGPEGRPPLGKSGAWIDTGVDNLDGQVLYHHLANTGHDQEPVGFVDVGVYHPPEEAGKPTEESRVGMIITPDTLEQVVAASGSLVSFEAAYLDIA